MHPRLYFSLLVLCFGFLAGCAAGGPGAAQAVADTDQKALEHAQAEALYNTGRGLIAEGNAESALAVYEELQADYPFSEFATQAALESIYANYLLSQWEAALAGADRFIKQHPRHPAIDYVYYLRGMVHFKRAPAGGILNIPKDQRDTVHLRQAFTSFNLLIRVFPDSVYNKDAQLHMIEIRNRLAAYELAVAEYYLERRAWVAAIRRAKYLIAHFQGTDSVPRTLEIMAHAYRELGLDDLARNARAVRVASYPDLPVSSDSVPAATPGAIKSE